MFDQMLSSDYETKVTINKKEMLKELKRGEEYGWTEIGKSK